MVQSPPSSRRYEMLRMEQDLHQQLDEHAPSGLSMMAAPLYSTYTSYEDCIGDVIEIVSQEIPNTVDYFHVYGCIDQSDGSQVLDGHIMRQTSRVLGGIRHDQEVTLLMNLIKVGSAEEDKRVTTTTHHIIRDDHGEPIRKNLVWTSKHMSTDVQNILASFGQAGKDVLVCRTIQTQTFYERKGSRVREETLRHLYASECNSPSYQAIADEEYIRRARQRRRRTYGTCFCGGGGDLLGAVIAGANAVFATDRDRDCCDTIRFNHPMTDVLRKECRRVIPYLERYRIDILHISCPCQFFSPCNTHKWRGHSANDEHNSAALFAIRALIQACQPLYVTFENTAGLTHDNHMPYFRAVITDMIELGYNVKWKVDNFRIHGTANSRPRLVLYASRIELPIPEFPEPTHGPAVAVPWTTLRDELGPPFPREQGNCIMTSGGYVRTKDKKKWKCTPSQIKKLQKFPSDYHLEGRKSSVARQLGNAIPPTVWSKYVSQIIQILDNFSTAKINADGNPISTVDECEGEHEIIPDPLPDNDFNFSLVDFQY